MCLELVFVPNWWPFWEGKWRFKTIYCNLVGTSAFRQAQCLTSVGLCKNASFFFHSSFQVACGFEESTWLTYLQAGASNIASSCQLHIQHATYLWSFWTPTISLGTGTTASAWQRFSIWDQTWFVVDARHDRLNKQLELGQDAPVRSSSFLRDRFSRFQGCPELASRCSLGCLVHLF